MNKICKNIINDYGSTDYSLQNVLSKHKVTFLQFSELKRKFPDFVESLHEIETIKLELVRSKVVSQGMRGNKDAIKLLQKEIQKENNQDSAPIMIEVPVNLNQLTIDKNYVEQEDDDEYYA